MKTLKRLFDVLVSSLLLLVLSPLLVLIALIVRLDSPGPALFRQERLGQDQGRFIILKFRTMHHRTRIDQVREAVVESDVDPRITRVGRFLRKASLDELPQLINVVKGDMSLVGPRPVLPEQLRAIPDEHMDRFTMKPGITGLAQVRGRRSLNWLEQLRYDSEYCRNWSFLLDLKILGQTVWVVLTGQGV